MTSSKPRVPAVEGWFIEDDGSARLLGRRCRGCGTCFFPPRVTRCGNPGCGSSDFEEAQFSSTGRLWSYTNACYPPPPPYVAADPYVPFAIAAVELEREAMVVLGQVADGYGVEDLQTGMTMELVVEPLYEDDAEVHMIWRWRPAQGDAS